MTSVSDRLRRWSMGHAAVLIAATVIAARTGTIVPLLAAASLTFLTLIAGAVVTRHASALSLPNLVTGLRFVCITTLAWAASATAGSDYLLCLTGFGLLLSDALDGWLARRYQSMTSIGALLDEEADAYFLLALCTVAGLNGQLGWWILMPGLLRYVFVLGRPLLGRNDRSVRLRSRRGRIVFVVMVVAMLITLLPIPAVYVPGAISATGLLVLSFAVDTFTLITARPIRFSAIKNRGRRLLLILRQGAGDE